jgi:hypothetical protein
VYPTTQIAAKDARIAIVDQPSAAAKGSIVVVLTMVFMQEILLPACRVSPHTGRTYYLINLNHSYHCVYQY